MPTDEFLRKDDAAKLIRELAVRPPVKGMANVKAATEVFAANVPAPDTADDIVGVGPAAVGAEKAR